MPLTLKIFQRGDSSGMFRQLTVEFGATCATAAAMICAKYGVAEHKAAFALYEQRGQLSEDVYAR